MNIPQFKPEVGKLLLAEPFMLEPIFRRSTILLCEHNEKGSLGFIINKELKVPVEDLISGFPEFKANVFYGGPVQTDTIHYLHTAGDLLDGSIEVSPGIYWGGDFEKLKFLITNKLIKSHQIRFFLGYSGWTTGQLQSELKSGSWMTTEMDKNYLFYRAPFKLWEKVLKDHGGPKAVIADIISVQAYLN